jgi:hypothetical protein
LCLLEFQTVIDVVFCPNWHYAAASRHAVRLRNQPQLQKKHSKFGSIVKENPGRIKSQTEEVILKKQFFLLIIMAIIFCQPLGANAQINTANSQNSLVQPRYTSSVISNINQLSKMSPDYR